MAKNDVKIQKETETEPVSKDTQKILDAANPQANPTNSENKTNESEVAPDDTAKTENQANATVAQSTKGKTIVKEEKHLASIDEKSSLKPEEVVGLDAVKEEVACAEGLHLPSTSVTSESQLDATEESKDKQSALDRKDSTNVETEGEATSGQLDKCGHDLKPVSDGEFAQMELEAEVTEPMDVESSSESKDQKLTDTKTEPTDGHPETSAVQTSPLKAAESPQGQQTTFKTNETSVKASSPDQGNTEAVSEPAAGDLKTGAGTSENKQETAKQTETKQECMLGGCLFFCFVLFFSRIYVF